MLDTAVLEADLLKILKIAEKDYTVVLAKKKGLCEKLSHSNFESVVRELFTRDKIIEFLSSSGITVGMVAEKSSLTAAVQQAAIEFQEALLTEVYNVRNKNPPNQGSDIIAKYIQIDANGVVTADPAVLEYIHNFMVRNNAIDSRSISSEVDSVNNKVKMEFSWRGFGENIEVNINKSTFNSFIAEHFLVNDLGNNMASFELDY